MTHAAESTARGLDDAVRALDRAQRLAIVAHVNPDADAIGSMLGLSGGLRATGKQVVSALSDPVSDYARFLGGAECIRSDLPSEDFDLLVCLDSADIERVGDLYTRNLARFEATPVLNVDHHRTNPLYGTVNYVDAAASSTSELCFRLLSSLHASVDPSTATALLFGIVGDTGSFRNGATTPGSLEAAARLLELGADNQTIAFELFERKRFAAARLWGRVLSGIQLDRERGIVFAYLSQAMLKEDDVDVSEREGLVEYLRGVEEAELVMLLRETEEGEVRVSMRSRPRVDVAAIATALGGGGHRQAAGCTIAGPVERAQTTLVATYDALYPR